MGFTFIKSYVVRGKKRRIILETLGENINYMRNPCKRDTVIPKTYTPGMQ